MLFQFKDVEEKVLLRYYARLGKVQNARGIHRGMDNWREQCASSLGQDSGATETGRKCTNLWKLCFVSSGAGSSCSAYASGLGDKCLRNILQ